MKKILVALLFLMGVLNLNASFTNDVMEVQIHWKPQSQWGVFMRVSPTAQAHSWASSDPTYKYVPIATLKYSSGADELALVQASSTGYALKPDMYEQYLDLVGLNPVASDYVPYSAVKTPTIIEEKQWMAGGKSTAWFSKYDPAADISEYNAAAHKAVVYNVIIDPYALINNLTTHSKVETFAMFPCNKYGTTTRQFWFYMEGLPNKIPSEACQITDGDIATYSDSPEKDIGWWRSDVTLYEDSFMRFAAAQDQNYLTIAQVNNVASSILEKYGVRGDAYFGNVFAIYYSNDLSLTSEITPVLSDIDHVYSIPKVEW